MRLIRNINMIAKVDLAKVDLAKVDLAKVDLAKDIETIR